MLKPATTLMYSYFHPAYPMKYLFRMSTTLAVVLFAWSRSASAQATIPVTILLKEEFGRPEITAIVRVDGSKSPRPVIALKRAALSPELLMAAVAILPVARTKSSNSGNQLSSVEITTRNRLRPIKEQDLQWARSILSSLQARPETNIAAVGKVRELVAQVPIPQ